MSAKNLLIKLFKIVKYLKNHKLSANTVKIVQVLEYVIKFLELVMANKEIVLLYR